MKKIIIIISTLFVLLYMFFFKIDKKAIKLADLKDDVPYILVQAQYSTASNWEIIGDNTGLFDIPIDVELNGMIPNVKYDLQIDNTFICYGEYMPDHLNLAGYNNRVYNVASWDILFPIKHNSIYSFLMSNKYIYTMEYNNKEKDML